MKTEKEKWEEFLMGTLDVKKILMELFDPSRSEFVKVEIPPQKPLLALPAPTATKYDS